VSLTKKQFRTYGDDPYDHLAAKQTGNPYYPQDYDNWTPQALQGSSRYKSWTEFKKGFPFNAELLVHLFGERDAIDCHRSMQTISEVKAATLCSFFLATRSPPSRVSIVSDC